MYRWKWELRRNKENVSVSYNLLHSFSYNTDYKRQYKEVVIVEKQLQYLIVSYYCLLSIVEKCIEFLFNFNETYSTLASSTPVKLFLVLYRHLMWNPRPWFVTSFRWGWTTMVLKYSIPPSSWKLIKTIKLTLNCKKNIAKKH